MKTTDQTLAYTLARVGMGINLTIHGIVRIPKLNTFADHITSQFENSYLPSILVKPYAYVLPFAELIIGALMLIGLFTRQTLVAASILIISLILGSCIIENWGNAGSQMVYLAYITTLLALRQNHNQLSLDHRRNN